MSWTKQPIFFLDFEGSRASGVVEYGMVTLLGGEIVECRTRTCRPTGPVRPDEIAVHRLDPESLGGCASLADDWEFFASRRERGPFAAHYAGVENSLLKSVWPYPRSSPDFARPGERTVEWGPWIDTARLYAQFFPAGSGNLAAVVAAAGQQEELDRLAGRHCPPARRAYHAALYDALAGALLLREFGRRNDFGSLSLGRLLALSTLDGTKRSDLLQARLL